jgi:hypothetical protein
MIKMVAAFDLFYLLVENVFGGIYIALIGIIIMFFLLGMISRMSEKLLIFMLLIFIAHYLMIVLGLGSVLMIGLFSMIYLGKGIWKYYISGRDN